MRIISLIVALCLATSSFGAVNGRLQASIDSVAALPSGGTVFIPAGTYVTGTLRLYSGVRLHLEAGAKILGSTDPFDYEGYADTSSDRRGLASDKCSKPQFALIVASNAHNIAITGPGNYRRSRTRSGPGNRQSPPYRRESRSTLQSPAYETVAAAKTDGLRLCGFASY